MFHYIHTFIMFKHVNFEKHIWIPTLHKKWSFPLRISSENVTKTSFFVHWYVKNKKTKHVHFKISSRDEVFSRLFSLFFIPGGIFIPAFLMGMSSSRNEVSSLQKRVNSTRHFTIGGDDFVLGRVSSRDEIWRANTLVLLT